MSVSVREYNDYIAFVDGVRFENGAIEVDQSIVDQLQKYRLAVFKNVFDPEYLTDVRRKIVHHEYEKSDYEVNDQGLPYNFSRWDDLLHRERSAHKLQIYNLYPWNEGTPEEIETLRVAFTRFSNKVSNKNVEDFVSLDGNKIGAIAGYYYPPGGCLLSHHFSDDSSVGFGGEDGFDEITILMSTYGKDYHEGGLHVAPRHRLALVDDPANHGELHFLEPELGIGDVVAFNIRDTYHIVKPVDPDKDIPFDPMNSRFLLSYCLHERADYSALAANEGDEMVREKPKEEIVTN